MTRSVCAWVLRFAMVAGSVGGLGALGCGGETQTGGDAFSNGPGGGIPNAPGVGQTPGSAGVVSVGGGADTGSPGPGPGVAAGGNTTGAGGSIGAGGTTGVGGNPIPDPTGQGGTDPTGTAGAAAGGAANPTDCMIPPPPSPLIGWATEGAGTTGGGDLEPEVVTTTNDLNAAISGTGPRVIHVLGSLTGTFVIGSNKTIIGVCGAELRGDVHLNGSSNVILRNLRVVGNNCTDSPADCSGGEDAISVNGGADHLWFDHLDVSDGSDGNLDITQGSDFITVSWTKFSYSSLRTDAILGASGHRFSNLIGASDTDPLDVGHLNITYHHCWWADNVNQRMPRSRRGQIHMLNNLFTSTGNSVCTNAGQDARLLVENSLYINVTGPLQLTENGDIRSVGNEFVNTTRGTTDPGGVGFVPPYTYQADPTAGLEAALRSGVGPK